MKVAPLYLMATLLVYPGTALSQSDPLDHWSWRSPVPTSALLHGITYANGLFVAVGANDGRGGIITSFDGNDWTHRSTPIDSSLLGVGYGLDRFVAVGETGTILTSSNGVAWTSQLSVTTNGLRAVCSGKGTLVVVGFGGAILTSADGETWHKEESGTQQDLSAVAFGNDSFVAVGGSGVLMRSTDGRAWNVIRSESGFSFFDGGDITFNQGVFVAVGQYLLGSIATSLGVSIATSVDGVNWTGIPWLGPGYELFSGIAYGQAGFVAISGFNHVVTSSDGTNWVRAANLQYTAPPLYGIAYGQGKYIAVGEVGTLISSSNGVDWTNQQLGQAGSLYDVTSGGDILIAVGVGATATGSQTILTSTDGVSWHQSGLPNGPPMFGATYGNGRFVAVGSLGDFSISQFSLDGTNWSYGDTYFGEHLRTAGSGVVFGNNVFVSVGEGQSNGWGPLIAVSTDGNHWTQISTSNYLSAVAFGGGRFIAVGGRIMVSANAVDWQTVPSGTTSPLNGIAYGQGKYVAVGEGGTILVSVAGDDWQQVTSENRERLTAVTYGNGAFVAVGARGTILTSTDALSWNIRQSGTVNDLYGVTYAHASFFVVGARGTILQSDSIVLPDVVFEHEDGLLGVWLMNKGPDLISASFFNPDSVADPRWHIVGTGNFTVTNKTDLLFQHEDGTLAIWFMDGTNLLSAVLLNPSQPGQGWKVAGIGDMNHDGKKDILFQHTDGTLAVWFMDGINLLQGALLNPNKPGDSGWRVVGTAALSSAGDTDLVLQHSDGTLAAWYMDGTNLVSGALLSPSAPDEAGWRVATTLDLNGDGKTDLLFQHDDGTVAVWLMDGINLISGQFLNPSNPGKGWRIAGPR